jgi:hypothetical protein
MITVDKSPKRSSTGFPPERTHQRESLVWSSKWKNGFCCILTPQQHTDFHYRFAMPALCASGRVSSCRTASSVAPCPTGVELAARRPGAWAKLLRGAVGDDWYGKRPLGSGAIGRCFGRHRHILEQRLNIIKTKSTAVTGWHYQLSIRPDANIVDAGLMNETAA